MQIMVDANINAAARTQAAEQADPQWQTGHFGQSHPGLNLAPAAAVGASSNQY